MKTWKAKQLSLALAALLAAGGLWLARSAWRVHTSQKSSMGKTTQDQKTSHSVDFKPPGGDAAPGRELRPPDPTRRFTDFTPEQRVEFARKGHGPGG